MAQTRKSHIGKDGRVLTLDKAFFARLKADNVRVPFIGENPTLNEQIATPEQSVADTTATMTADESD